MLNSLKFSSMPELNDIYAHHKGSKDIKLRALVAPLLNYIHQKSMRSSLYLCSTGSKFCEILCNSSRDRHPTKFVTQTFCIGMVFGF